MKKTILFVATFLFTATALFAQAPAPTPARLSFYYQGGGLRPVTEFVARITERSNPRGRVYIQKCNEDLEYAAGNYHVSINTLPPTERNFDLDSTETMIVIPQPGFANFIHDDNIRQVILYKQDVDWYAPFDTLDMNTPAAKPLMIQPGYYEAHYHNGRDAKEKIVSFFIKPAKTQNVKLR